MPMHMDITETETTIEEKVLTVYHPMVQHQSNGNPEVMRITEEEDLTRIDFVYRSGAKYVNGGWVQINRGMFIRPSGSSECLVLVRAFGIPYAPVKHYFNRAGEVLYFTLYFPALPKGTESIDIIECEHGGEDFFNFYGVGLDHIKREPLYIQN